MSYMTDGLTFNELRSANQARLPEFRNSKGILTHPNGVEDWTLSQWSNAMCGEAGEAANVVKKFERGDIDITNTSDVKKLADELADLVTYCDLLAARAGIDLGRAIISKFNEISSRVGSSVYFNGVEWTRKTNV